MYNPHSSLLAPDFTLNQKPLFQHKLQGTIMLNYFLDDNTNRYRIDFFDDEAYIYNVKLSDEARQKLANLIHGKNVYTKLNQNGCEELGCETMTADDFLKICADIDVIQSQHQEGNLPIEMDMATSWQFKGKMVLKLNNYSNGMIVMKIKPAKIIKDLVMNKIILVKLQALCYNTQNNNYRFVEN